MEQPKAFDEVERSQVRVQMAWHMALPDPTAFSVPGACGGARRASRHSAECLPPDVCAALAAESLVWRCLKELPNSPPACAGHTLTGAGRHGVLAFGGAGKHCSGALHRFHPRALTWEPLAATGVRPNLLRNPRQCVVGRKAWGSMCVLLCRA